MRFMKTDAARPSCSMRLGVLKHAKKGCQVICCRSSDRRRTGLKRCESHEVLKISESMCVIEMVAVHMKMNAKDDKTCRRRPIV